MHLIGNECCIADLKVASMTKFSHLYWVGLTKALSLFIHILSLTKTQKHSCNERIKPYFPQFLSVENFNASILY